jgi:nucleoside-diphosphate-sugar epimerase
MRALVLGATGFIGPSVVERLQAHGAEVGVVTRGGKQIPEGVTAFETNRLSLPTDFKPDAVVDVRCLNMADVRPVVSYCQRIKARYVLIGSVDVYRAFGVLNGIEEGRYPTPISEESELRTRLYPYADPYPEEDQKETTYDKIPVEDHVRRELGSQGVILRLPMVYGPRDRQRRTWRYADPCSRGRSTVLLPPGMGDWRAPRGYVDDIGEACALCAIHPSAGGETFIVADEPSLTERDWIARIARGVGAEAQVWDQHSEPVPSWLESPIPVDQHISVTTAKIRSLLGYREVTEPEEAMRRTVAWELANPPEKLGRDREADEDAYLAERN